MSYGNVPRSLRKYYRWFILSKVISENSFHDEDEVFDYLDDNGYLSCFKNRKIVRYLNEVASFDDSYVLKDKYFIILKSLREVKGDNNNKTKSELFKEIKSYLDLNRERMMYHFDNEYLYQVSMYILDNHDLAEFSFFYVSIKFQELSYKYENQLFNLFDKNNTLNFKELSKNHYFNLILEAIDVENIREMIELPLSIIVPAFNVFSNDFLQLLRFQYYDYESEITSHLHYIIESTKESYIDILVKRNGWDNKQPKTLEDLGTKYHLTRERMRQLEKNAINDVVTKAKLEKQLFIEYCEFIFHYSKNSYISFDYISSLYGTNAGILLLIFGKLGSNKYEYLPKYQLLIKKTVSIDEVFNVT